MSKVLAHFQNTGHAPGLKKSKKAPVVGKAKPPHKPLHKPSKAVVPSLSQSLSAPSLIFPGDSILGVVGRLPFPSPATETDLASLGSILSDPSMRPVSLHVKGVVVLGLSSPRPVRTLVFGPGTLGVWIDLVEGSVQVTHVRREVGCATITEGPQPSTTAKPPGAPPGTALRPLSSSVMDLADDASAATYAELTQWGDREVFGEAFEQASSPGTTEAAKGDEASTLEASLEALLLTVRDADEPPPPPPPLSRSSSSAAALLSSYFSGVFRSDNALELWSQRV